MWQSIDHILVSHRMRERLKGCFVNDLPFLMESDEKFGGVKPFRTYNGYRYANGFSDHLPLVAQFELEE